VIIWASSLWRVNQVWLPTLVWWVMNNGANDETVLTRSREDAKEKASRLTSFAFFAAAREPH